MKRYPWNVSYGNKHADKAIEATKTLLEKQNKVSVPPPSNMDAESAKSLLIFLLKVSVLVRAAEMREAPKVCMHADLNI